MTARDPDALVRELEAAGANLLCSPSLVLGEAHYALHLSEADDLLSILVRHASPEVRAAILRELYEARLRTMAEDQFEEVVMSMRDEYSVSRAVDLLCVDWPEDDPAPEARDD